MAGHSCYCRTKCIFSLNRFRSEIFLLPYQFYWSFSYCESWILITEKYCLIITVFCNSFVFFPCKYFQGLPVFAVGLGLSTFDKASVSMQCLFLLSSFWYWLQNRPQLICSMLLGVQITLTFREGKYWNANAGSQ